MNSRIAVFGLICFFLASMFVDEALGKKLEIVIRAKLPPQAQQMLNTIDTIVTPIRDSLDLEMLEKELPKKTKRVAPKKADKPALGWDFDKREVKFATR